MGGARHLSLYFPPCEIYNRGYQRLIAVKLTVRDQSILDALAGRVRLFALGQVAEAWWSGSSAEIGRRLARKRLGQLCNAGFILKTTVLARPLPEIAEPVFSWKPGAERPDCGAIAWQLMHRWAESSRETSVYLITPTGARLYGGKKRGQLRNDYQATHDLGLSQVFVRYLRTSPELASKWIGEDLRKQTHGEKANPG